ncbi:MAG TPA: cardiolipin synthase ClsB [Eoetvoesiella sp.]
MTTSWTSGNSFTLLENGESFFPRVFEAIRSARKHVVVETFILFDDKVGRELRQVLIEAALRGVHVDITVDGYGSGDLSAEFVEGLTSAGVGFHVYDLRPRRFGVRTNLFRRMHRKVVVVDEKVAFVGGINFGVDHLAEYGPEAKQDYAVELTGPVVDQIYRFEAEALAPALRRFSFRRKRMPGVRAPDLHTDSQAAFVYRDNAQHTGDIELQYRLGIRAAQNEITIANAYFFPGYRFLRDLRNAAKRGVSVRLILQGEPDMPVAKFASTMLYDYLLSAGVRIYEYCERPLHGKVATFDGVWATVGSSNLDPLSLSLNLEANVIIRDENFAAGLLERLEDLMRDKCTIIERASLPRRNIQRVLVGVLVFHFLRRFPSWLGRLPVRKPELTTLGVEADESLRSDS